MLALSAGEYTLTFVPERGGSMLRFAWRGQLLVGREGGPCNHALSSRDWRKTWSVAASTSCSATLLLDHVARDCAFVASQAFVLDDAGLTMTLALANLGPGKMPSDIGFGLGLQQHHRDIEVVNRQGDDAGPTMIEPGAVRTASLRLRAAAAGPVKQAVQPPKLSDSLAKKSLNIIRVSTLW